MFYVNNSVIIPLSQQLLTIDDIFMNWNVIIATIVIIIIFNFPIMFWLLRFLIGQRVEILSFIVSFIVIRNITNFVYMLVNSGASAVVV